MRCAQGGGLTPKEQLVRVQVRLEAGARFERGEENAEIAAALRVGRRQVEKLRTRASVRASQRPWVRAASGHDTWALVKQLLNGRSGSLNLAQGGGPPTEDLPRPARLGGPACRRRSPV